MKKSRVQLGNAESESEFLAARRAYQRKRAVIGKSKIGSYEMGPTKKRAIRANAPNRNRVFRV